MSLTILSVAYPLVPVSPDTVGGAEQTLSLLDREIEKAGHRSIVIAARGSVTRGRLLASPDWRGEIDNEIRRWAAREHARIISKALREFPIDVVHLHGLDFFDYLPREDVACLATLHLPPEWYPPAVFATTRPRTFFNCVSEHQRRRCPPSRVPIRTIPQGIDTELFFSATTGNYALILGRICPEKGFHFAIDAADKAGVPLIIAGQIYAYAGHQNYFQQRIAPRLNHQVRFIGPVGFRDKRRLLAHAHCVLIPSTVAETSSLVALEALASGTPVIAFPSGALAEIVDDGATGYIVSDSTTMAEAIGRVTAIDRTHCQSVPRLKFSVTRMMEDYFRAYLEICGRIT